MRNLARILVLASLCLAFSSKAQTANVIFNFSNYVSQAVNVASMTLNPILPGPAWTGGYNATHIPTFTRANMPSLTNGTLTVTNLLINYAYQLIFSDGYSTYYFTNFFDSELISNGATIYGADYQAVNINRGSPFRPAYLSTTVSNLFYNFGIATNVFFGNGNNTIYRQFQGTNYFDVPDETFDAYGAAQAATNGLASTNFVTTSIAALSNAFPSQLIVAGVVTNYQNNVTLSTATNNQVFTIADTNGIGGVVIDPYAESLSTALGYFTIEGVLATTNINPGFTSSGSTGADLTISAGAGRSGSPSGTLTISGGNGLAGSPQGALNIGFQTNSPVNIIGIVTATNASNQFSGSGSGLTNIPESGVSNLVGDLGAFANDWNISMDTNGNYFANNFSERSNWESNDFSGLMTRVLGSRGNASMLHIIIHPAPAFYTNVYWVSNSIVVTNGSMVIEGCGNPCTLLEAAPVLNGPIFQLGTDTIGVGQIVRFNRLRIYGTYGNTNCSGVELRNVTEPNFEDDEMGGFGVGAIIDSNLTVLNWSQIENCWFVAVQNGESSILLSPTSAQNSQDALSINNCLFGLNNENENCVNVASDARNIRIANSRFYCGSTSFTNSHAIFVQNGFNFIFTGNQIQDWRSQFFKSPPIFFSDRATNSNVNALIANNVVDYANSYGSQIVSNMVWVGQNVYGVRFGLNNNFGGNIANTNFTRLKEGDTNLVAYVNSQAEMTITTNGVTASSFMGNGGGLTNLTATNLVGTIPLGNLDPSVLTNGSSVVLTNNNNILLNGLGVVTRSGSVTGNDLASYSAANVIKDSGISALNQIFNNNGGLLTNLSLPIIDANTNGLISRGGSDLTFMSGGVPVAGGTNSTFWTTNLTVNGTVTASGTISSSASIGTSGFSAQDILAPHSITSQLFIFNSSLNSSKPNFNLSGNTIIVGDGSSHSTQDIGLSASNIISATGMFIGNGSGLTNALNSYTNIPPVNTVTPVWWIRTTNLNSGAIGLIPVYQ